MRTELPHGHQPRGDWEGSTRKNKQLLSCHAGTRQAADGLVITKWDRSSNFRAKAYRTKKMLSKMEVCAGKFLSEQGGPTGGTLHHSLPCPDLKIWLQKMGLHEQHSADCSRPRTLPSPSFTPNHPVSCSTPAGQEPCPCGFPNGTTRPKGEEWGDETRYPCIPLTSQTPSHLILILQRYFAVTKWKLFPSGVA